MSRLKYLKTCPWPCLPAGLGPDRGRDRCDPCPA